MRIAITVAVLVLALLVYLSRDRLALDHFLDPAATTEPDVAAPPPEPPAGPPHGLSPPPVPAFPQEEDSPKLQFAGLSPEMRTYVIRKGDTLWSISLDAYGTGHHARAIYKANRDQIKDPANLRAGQELILP